MYYIFKRIAILLLNCNLNEEIKIEIHNILLKHFFQADGITRAQQPKN